MLPFAQMFNKTSLSCIVDLRLYPSRRDPMKAIILKVNCYLYRICWLQNFKHAKNLSNTGLCRLSESANNNIPRRQE